MLAMSFAGTWTTVFQLYDGDEGIPGTLKIREEEGQLVGSYQPNDGTVTGTAPGNVFSGRWCQKAACGSGLSFGEFRLFLDPLGQSFSGTWCYRDGTHSGEATWTGKRAAF